MSTWTSNNKLNFTGSITTGLVLSMSNADAGTIPADMSLTTYNDFNYGDDYYEYKAIFEGAYSGDHFAHSVEWTATTSLASLKYQYALSNDGIVYDAWTGLANALTSKTAILANKYFKMRFIVDGGAWTDSDYLKIISISSTFTPFVKNTIIEANEMNANFYFVGSGDLLPHGGANLNLTTSVYNIGSDITPWNTIYCNDIVISSSIQGTLGLISKVTLSATTSRIEFNGLNGDNYAHIMVIGKIKATNNTITGYPIKMIFNGDSGANYGYYAKTNTSTANFIAVHTLDTIQAIAYNDLLECYIKTRSGNEKTTFSQSLFSGRNSTAPSHMITVGIWSSDVTLTSIIFHTDAVFNINTTFYLYGMEI